MAANYGRPRRERRYVYSTPLLEKESWPKCLTCKKPLKPNYSAEIRRSGEGEAWASVVYIFGGTYGYEGNNHFCTQRCGYQFGLAVAKRLETKGA